MTFIPIEGKSKSYKHSLIIYWTALVYRNIYVRFMTTQNKILKNRPVPGRLSNSPVMCKSLKSYDVSFICDRSINM